MLFPPRCAGCGARGALFCDQCVGGLHWIRPPICARCGDPLPACVVSRPRGGPGAPREPAWLDLCRSCVRRPPAFALARSIAVYGGSLREAIHGFKYRGRRPLADPLGRLLAATAPPETLRAVRAVVPVPLHARRLAERGFNQAALLAEAVARAAAVPCLPDALRRLRQEVPQAKLGAADRHRNVRGAFAPGRSQISGTVLLIDDVFSTGATAEACAQALLEGGSGRVVVLTLARAVPGALVGTALASLLRGTGEK